MSPLAVESQRNANWPSSISLLLVVFLLCCDVRDVKQISNIDDDDCFMFQHISTSKIFFNASAKPPKKQSLEIIKLCKSNSKKLTQKLRCLNRILTSVNYNLSEINLNLKCKSCNVANYNRRC